MMLPPSPWLASYGIVSNPKMRLFCFPYAGGNCALFRSWASLLPPYVEVIGVSAPGKGSRALETPCRTVDELVSRLMESMRSWLAEKPYSLFGHSNGALISFELCNVLQARGLPMPEHLFLSGSPAPWTRTFEKRYSEMNDEEFKQVLRDLDGTPSEVFENNDLYGLVSPGLRADFELSESYVYTHGRSLSVPTTLIRGERDEVTLEQTVAWGDRIENIVRLETIDGGHFFIHSHRKRLVSIVRNQLHADSVARTRGKPGNHASRATA